MNTSPHNQSTTIAIGVLSVILVILLGIIGWKLANKEETTTNKPSTSQESQDSQDSDSSDQAGESSQDGTLPAGIGSLQRNSRNVERKQDASRLATAAAEYMANNNGDIPSDIKDDELMGAPDDTRTPVELDFYASASVQRESQPALTQDRIVLVTSAICGLSGETIIGSKRQYAIQYTQEQAGGTFKPTCLDA